MRGRTPLGVVEGDSEGRGSGISGGRNGRINRGRDDNSDGDRY